MKAPQKPTPPKIVIHREGFPDGGEWRFLIGCIASLLTVIVFILWAANAFAAVPIVPPLTDTVALIEINHHHDTAGRPIFTQAIYYDWCPIAQRHQVRA